MANVNVDEILKQAEKINNAIVKHNNENQKYEGFREATKNRLIEQINDYNNQYGTSLSLEDPDSLQKEYVKVVKEIFTTTKHMEEVLQAVQENDIKKVSELTGIDIAQDTIKLPQFNIDMDEMEKQADKAYRDTLNHNKDVQQAVGTNLGVSEDEIVEVEENEDEDEEEVLFDPSALNLDDGVDDEDKDNAADQPNIRSFFDGIKIAPESEASKKESQTEENTEPNFSNIFSSIGQDEDNSKQNNPKEETNVPDFSNMFAKVKDETEENEDEDKDSKEIGSFIENFKTDDVKKDSGKTNKDKKIDDALKQQPHFPAFDFGDINLDED